MSKSLASVLTGNNLEHILDDESLKPLVDHVKYLEEKNEKMKKHIDNLYNVLYWGRNHLENMQHNLNKLYLQSEDRHLYNALHCVRNHLDDMQFYIKKLHLMSEDR